MNCRADPVPIGLSRSPATVHSGDLCPACLAGPAVYKIANSTLETRIQAMPVKKCTGIGLSPGCNFTVSNHRIPAKRRVVQQQCPDDALQRGILRIRVGTRIRTFQLDAYRKVIAPNSPTPLRDTRMPGPSIKWNQLGDSTPATDENVRTDPYAPQRGQ